IDARQQKLFIKFEIAYPIDENEGLKYIERRLLNEFRACAQQDLFPMERHHFGDRNASWLILFQETGEERRLQDAQANIEADTHQKGAQQERDTPAPGSKLAPGQPLE